MVRSNHVRSIIVLHDGTFKLSRDSNLATALKGEVLDTHTLESRHVMRANLEYSRGN
jgi:hypothetical protein